ncbi:MAG: DNA mismatch repair endonuclease MutL [Oscillospiraceae bacterium]|jgi:DNA mismatch repair protein MutL|nr:DNA mismatch repair endonuclease MutL [Oscillospiraceae bacterium]
MIEILSPQVANLIAAGEVVERPAAALKELMENAVDAGATALTAEIRRGGVSLIRVTDNGEGMSPEDAARAFMRHATSKLRSAEGLQAIATLGFRGEALAAVAAVSRVELLTRRRGEAAGTSLTLEAGVVTAHGEAGCPEGTTIVVRDLFYNTPARQKFLKKDSTEAAAAQEAAVRAALARPGLSVRFIKDGAQTMHTPGDGDLKNCLYSVFGGELVRSLCPLPNSGGEVRVSGFTGLPALARSARFMQYFFVEGRPVRSRVLTAALEEAYAGSLMSGRFPVCCLHISMPLETFDINVHPAKSEIKFQYERAVFDAVYNACREALRQAGPEAAPAVRIAPYTPSGGPVPVLSASSPSVYAAGVPRPAGPLPSPPPPPPKPPEENLAWRLIGEVMSGYLLVETPEALWIIDKHAAHERVIFNRLKAGERPFLSQQLLVPRAVALSGPELDILTGERAFLEEAGFDIDVMGPGALAVRAAPGDVDESDIPALLSEIASLLLSGRRPDLRDEAMQMVACKAAVKLGRSSQREDMERLAGLVMETPDLRHCPHGRPVAMRLTRSDLGRQFGR